MPRKTAGSSQSTSRSSSSSSVVASSNRNSNASSLDVESAVRVSFSSDDDKKTRSPRRRGVAIPFFWTNLCNNNNNNNKMGFLQILQDWKGAYECGKAQLQMIVVLVVAYIGNNWPHSYPRNNNHSASLFWVMNGLLLLAALASMKHEPTTRNIQLLSRPQTEEWKGWMQFAFIMYHYYRMYTVYNEIRVFVSAYGA